MTSLESQVKECMKYIKNNFTCYNCSRCCICYDDIDITDREAKIITNTTKIPISDFVSNKPVKIKKTSKNLKILKKNVYEPCIFLKNKKCSIYKIRPSSCKNYPHSISKMLSKAYSLKEKKLIICVYPYCKGTSKILDEIKQKFGVTFKPIENDFECDKALKKEDA